MKTILLLTTLLISLLVPAYADSNHCSAEEISEKARQQVALAALRAAPHTVQVYAKGLICQSCGIGVRKKLQRLSFTDRSRFNKGIDMDVKTQLVTVALKEGQTYDAAEVTKAVRGAGYTPVTLYALDAQNQLQSISLAQE